VGRVFEPLPQLLRSVRFGETAPLAEPEVARAIADGRKRLGDAGRLLIRKSGTEPLIRVMAEGEDAGLVEQVVAAIVEAVERAAARNAA
jgi:phosphoglucosamine mutase